MPKILDTSTILSIIGPTGIGKTALSARFATSWLQAGVPVSVISLDSRQVYQEFPQLAVADLPIWTNLQKQFGQKLQVYNLATIHLHEDWSFGVLLNVARDQLHTSLQEKRHVILVGGTLICHQKILVTQGDFTTIPPDDNVRFAAEAMTVPQLQAWLQKIDPATFASLNQSDLNNPRRLIRHIEISLARKLGTIREQPTEFASVSQKFCIPAYDRAALRSHIFARVEERFRDPAIRGEVHQVLHDWPEILDSPKLLSRTPLGFIPLARLEKGELSASQALSDWQHAEWHYAKRQDSFTRKLVADHHTDLIDQREFLTD